LVTGVSALLGGEAFLDQALAMVGLAVSLLGCGGFIVARKHAPQPVR
jgi:hypothetical protein